MQFSECVHTFSMDTELRNDRIPRNPFDRQFLDMWTRFLPKLAQDLAKLAKIMPAKFWARSYPRYGKISASWQDLGLLPRSYPEMSGQRRGLRISEYSRIFSHRNVWGPSIPSTPDFSQLLPKEIVCILHLS